MEPIIPIGRPHEGAPAVPAIKRLTPPEREAAAREREKRRRERARRPRPGAGEAPAEGGGSLDIRA